MDPQMDCQAARQRILDQAWTQAALDEAAALLAHIKTCDACRQAIVDFEQLRGALAAPDAVTKVEPDRGWRALEDRLASAMREPARAAQAGAEIPGGPGVVLRVAQSGARRGSWAWRAAGGLAAAAALVAVGWGMHGWEGGPRATRPSVAMAPTRGTGLPPGVPTATGVPGRGSGVPAHPGGATLAASATPVAQELQFSPAEVQEHAQVFQGVTEVFDRRAGWVALSGKSSEVGLSSKSLGAERRLLLLRLTVSRGHNVVSRSDVVIVPGQSANLTVGFEKGQQLEYRIGTTTQPVRLALWAEVKSPSHPGLVLAGLATNLPITPGKVIQAGEMVTASAEYELRVGFSQAQLPGVGLDAESKPSVPDDGGGP